MIHDRDFSPDQCFQILSWNNKMGPIFRNNWLKCFHTDFFPNKENDKESYARPVVSTRVSTGESTGVSTGVSTAVNTG